MLAIVNNEVELLAAFGNLGKTVSARPHRTHEEKELYCLRRYVLTLAAYQLLGFPLAIKKSETPDFIVTGVRNFGVEVTEATDEADQREYSLANKSGRDFWFNGQFGGRGNGGVAGMMPEQLWWSYIKMAIERKLPLNYSAATTRIVIYSNSNAGSVIDSAEACDLASQNFFDDHDLRQKCSGGTEISIIKDAYLLYDVGGSRQLLAIKD